MANTNITIFQENMKKENKCEICEKVFKTKAKLKVYYLNVHANNEKIVYKCNICMGSFQSKKRLQNHMKIFHGAQSVFCQ